MKICVIIGDSALQRVSRPFATQARNALSGIEKSQRCKGVAQSCNADFSCCLRNKRRQFQTQVGEHLGGDDTRPIVRPVLLRQPAPALPALSDSHDERMRQTQISDARALYLLENGIDAELAAQLGRDPIEYMPLGRAETLALVNPR